MAVLGGGAAAEGRCISCILDASRLTADISSRGISPVWLLSENCQSISLAKFCRLLTGFAEIGL